MDAQRARRTLDQVIKGLEAATPHVDPASADGKTLACLLRTASRCRDEIHVAITRVPENAWRHWLSEDCYAGVVETAESLEPQRLTGHASDPLIGRRHTAAKVAA
jgi:hypothetical protein